MRLIVLALCLLPHSLQAQTPAPAIPRFADESATAGLTGFYAGEWQYMVGGGVAVFDCNADGFEDMLIAGGENPAMFYRNVSQQGGPLQFRQETAGLEADAVTGAYPLDIDADGLTDLALLRVGENRLMRGLGNCRFAPANADWGFDGGDDWSTAFAATWEKGASWPTLAFGSYIDRTQEAFPWGSCTPNQLYRGGDGRFAAPLALTPGHCALSMLFTDWNRSGQPALRVSNDREYYKGGQEQLWQLDPGAAPVLMTEADGWKRLRLWGMGIASHDVTGDGYPDYYLTSMADNKLQTLESITAPVRPGYADTAFARGVTAHRPYTGGDLRPSTGWHAQFGDVNNDGLFDLFVAKGNVANMPDFALLDPNNLLLQQADGTFQEVGEAAGVDSMAIARGGQLADFNMDGLLDIVVVNRWQTAQLWRNISEDAGGFAAFRLQQPGPNRDAIGAWVSVRRGDTVTRHDVTVGGGHVSGQLGWVHFGLGTSTAAEVRVEWPGGRVDDWQPLLADTFQILAPGQAPVAFIAP
jgi:enediyne biosynthesis protein E4